MQSLKEIIINRHFILEICWKSFDEYLLEEIFTTVHLIMICYYKSLGWITSPENKNSHWETNLQHLAWDMGVENKNSQWETYFTMYFNILCEQCNFKKNLFTSVFFVTEGIVKRFFTIFNTLKQIFIVNLMFINAQEFVISDLRKT